MDEVKSAATGKSIYCFLFLKIVKTYCIGSVHINTKVGSLRSNLFFETKHAAFQNVVMLIMCSSSHQKEASVSRNRTWRVVVFDKEYSCARHVHF